MKHRTTYILILVLLLASVIPLMAQDTSSSDNPNETKTVVDVSGAEVEIPLHPQRIAIAWDRGPAELFAAAELPVVAVASREEYAPYLVEAFNNLEGIIDLGSHRTVNLEALLEAEPDLIVISVRNAPDILESAQQIAPTVQLGGSKGIRELIADFGAIMGDEYADKLNAQVDAAVAQMASVIDDPGSVVVSNGMILSDSIRLYMDNSNLASQLMAEAGFARPDSQLSGVDEIINNGTEISLEEVQQLDGDILFLGEIGTEEELEPIKSSPLWQTLTVVQNNRVVQSDWRYWNVGGPLAAQKIADDFILGFETVGLADISTDESMNVSFPVTVTDGSDFELTFDQPLERIVCLTSSCQDHLYVLGMQPIAIADYMIPVYELLYGTPPPEDIAILAIDIATFQPDLEQVLALQPDVVVAGLGLHDDMRQPLANAGIPVLLSYPDSLEDTLAEFELVATVTDHFDLVEAPVAAIQDRLSAYAELSPNDMYVLLVFGATERQELYVETNEAQTCKTLIDYELANCPATLEENAGQFAGFGYAQYTVEALLNLDPDAIFFAGYDDAGVDDPAVLIGVGENPLWLELSAVKNEQLYTINSWTFGGQSGLTLLSRAIDQTMQLLYPDLIPAPLTDEQIQDILVAN